MGLYACVYGRNTYVFIDIMNFLIFLLSYELSVSGWNENEKRKEMFDEAAYYLIAYDSKKNQPIGFSHFRFDIDYDDEVIYW